ncbi:MAG: class I SAM-dependent methyltransferase [Promethearchaeati archaeon SRVP18_Atabeyarchaeia-1]
MIEPRSAKPDYGNWVSKRLIYVPGAAGVFLLCLSFAFLILTVGTTAALPFDLSFIFLTLMVGSVGVILVGWAFIFPVSIIGAVGIPFLVSSFLLPPLAFGATLLVSMSFYFAYARHKFSPRGGKIQTKIQELVLRSLDWDGKGEALDIGCGNAPLTIRMAKKFSDARITGTDYWGGAWEYSKAVCERNAEIEGVASQVKFQKASASHLPFKDGFFDAAISNLVFHEVKDTKDKRDVIREALRVVKKGGKFAFQDLFLMKRVYGELDDLLRAVRSWGIQKVEFLDTSHSDFIPRALKPQFMVGAIGILHGKK